MKRRLFALLCSLCVLCCLSCGSGNSLERSTVGNGSEVPEPQAGSAWFLGKRPVRYCVAVAKDFGVDATEASKLVEMSFRSWRFYLESKHLNVPGEHAERFAQLAPPSLELRSNEIPQCDGSEDLAFYFGVESEETARDSAFFENPVAYAKRRRFDVKKGWSQGYIFIGKSHELTGIQPNWTGHTFELQTTVMHELGHVLGCGHVEGTVMTKDRSEMLAQRRWTERPEVPNAQFPVDWRRDLLLCESCATIRPGLLSSQPFPASAAPGQVALPVLIRSLFGPAQHVSFCLAANPVITTPNLLGAFAEQGIHFVVSSTFRVQHGGEPVFKIAYYAEGAMRIVQSFSDGLVSTGQFIDSWKEPPMKARDAVLLRNGKEAYFVLQPTPFKKDHAIFIRLVSP